MNDRQRVTKRHIEALRAEVDEHGLGTLAGRIFDDEPELQQAMFVRQKRMFKILRDADVPEDVADRLVLEATAMLWEQLLVLQRWFRGMLDDLLPRVDGTESDATSEGDRDG
jgi:hypothetical protein